MAYQQDQMHRNLGTFIHDTMTHNAVFINKESRIKELQIVISKMTTELEKLLLDDPMRGPTGRELNQHESLKNAWNEYLTVRQLLGL